ncbi:MAG: precorrin-8X methylmutase [Rhodospirillaceae bacterium]|nr:precorrin-8X methylmutase [Rhodospirillaceae bacterium]
MPSFEYIHEPDEIYAESFRRIEAEVDFKNFSGIMRSVAMRMVHASAMVEVAGLIKYSNNCAETGKAALQNGANVLVDAEMVKRGIITKHLPKNNNVECFLDAPGVADEAKARGETRSAIAVERWGEMLAGAVCVIGNAPTALFRLLEIIEKNPETKPALIIGLPVGFVGASESKEALIKNANDIPFITIQGRLGGSAMAAAVINAISIGGQ